MGEAGKTQGASFLTVFILHNVKNEDLTLRLFKKDRKSNIAGVQVDHLLNGIEHVEIDSSQNAGQIERQKLNKKTELHISFEPVKFLSLGMPIRPNAESLYVERFADIEARRAVEASDLLVVSGPRRIGKTSLLMQARVFAESIGKKSAFIDLQMFAGGTNGPQLYYELSLRLAKELELQEPDAKQFLRNPGTAFLDFLSKIDSKSIIFIDEYDMLHGLGILENFSSILRSFKNQKAARKQQQPGLLISSWLPPHRFIENLMMSPFNIGKQLRLTGFDRREADYLIRRVFPTLPVRAADTLHELVGGQPFLLQCGLSWLADGHTIDELLLVAADLYGPFGTYLQFLVHSVDDELRQVLADGDFTKLSSKQLAHLEDGGILESIRGGYAWAGGLHKMAFGQKV